MFVLTRIAEGLIVGHLCAALFFLLGAAVFPRIDSERSSAGSSATLLRVATIAAFGAAICGFALLFLAVVGLLYPGYIILLLAIIIAGAATAHRESPLSRAYWNKRIVLITGSIDLTSLLLYYILIVMSVPAVLPNIGSDPVNYHLAYATDWAQAGRLIIDPLLRYPFYASNFLLMYAALIGMHAAAFLNFLTWSMGLLTALGLYALARLYTIDITSRTLSAIIALFLALAVVTSPVYWRWLDTTYMDIPIAAFTFFATVAILLELRERKGDWLRASAVIAAFLAGMKPSYALLVPFFLVTIFIASKNLGLRRRELLAAFALLLALASPWYVRNLVLAGDPMPPALNIAVHGEDGLILRSEWQAVEADLGTKRTVNALASLPVRAYLQSLSLDFREYGVSALILLLYIPVLYVFIRFGFSGRVDGALLLFCALLVVLTAYWFLISTLLRYGLILMPILAAACALCARDVLKRFPKAGIALAAFAMLLVIPTPGSASWYHEQFSVDYRYLAQVYQSDDSYLRFNDKGYAAEQFTVELLRRRMQSGMVYVLGDTVNYYFHRDGFRTAGDWIGPGGYYRMYRAVDAREGGKFIESFGAAAVLIDKNYAVPGLVTPLERQLQASGFCRLTVPGGLYDLLVARAGCNDLIRRQL